MIRLLKRALVAFLGLSALHVLAAAQCPLPDGLDGGPCCTTVTPKLPLFPNFTQDALDICWLDCNVDQTKTCVAKWSATPLLPSKGKPCGERLMTLELSDALGVKWKGGLRLVYSRTWVEAGPAGTLLQVWRFLVNGDMSPTSAAGPIPCPVPPCVPAHGNKARFTGYLDYAMDCGGGPFQFAWMLSHVCDSIDHHAGFPRAGVFHPDRSYTFVGPAAGFVPGPIQPTEGTAGSAFEDVRRRAFPPLGAVGPITCEYEEPITHVLTPLQQFCWCGQPTAPAQFLVGNLSIAGVCGTSVTSSLTGLLPGFVSMGIGMWTIAGTYPGVEFLRWNVGSYDYVDPCVPGVIRREVFYGVSTYGGYTPFQLLSSGVGPALPLMFVDQANSLKSATMQTTIMNVPFVSDHILNLNH